MWFLDRFWKGSGKDAMTDETQQKSEHLVMAARTNSEVKCLTAGQTGQYAHKASLI